ncbi:multimerin-1-like [Centropristis striata]|uniref:multimerin-1-like n=1 Tax=Centropristis striata TaxID=184440 RepID=UPI0027E14C87|nr:multimerin-1-like [Centropristis striata]
MFSVFVIVMMSFVTSLVAAKPVEMFPLQSASRQQGVAVLFYVAHQGSLRDIEINPIIFKEIVVNQGAAYDNATGRFTAPVAGIYQFVFAAQLCRGSHNNAWYFIVKGIRRAACHAQVSGTDTTLNTCFTLEELKKGDQVWIKQTAGSCAWASTVSKTITFSGVLLASEGVTMLGGKYSSCPLPRVDLSRGRVSSSVGQSASWSSVAALLSPLGLLMAKL